MSINIVSIFVEDIERNFRGHLPQACINIIATMAEENRTLQNAVNDQMRIVEQLKQVMILSAEADRQILKAMKGYNETYTDEHNDIIKSQDIGEKE